MEFILIAAIVVFLGYLVWANNKTKPLDVNKDGKIDLNDAISVVPVLTQEIKGVVAKAEVEAKVAAVKVQNTAKKTVAKAKTTAKKTTTAVKTAVKKVAPKKAKK